jgi:hypothetical protein
MKLLAQRLKMVAAAALGMLLGAAPIVVFSFSVYPPTIKHECTLICQVNSAIATKARSGPAVASILYNRLSSRAITVCSSFLVASQSNMFACFVALR